MELAAFLAELAAVAHCRIDLRNAVFLLAHCRTARNQTLTAFLAGVLVDDALALWNKLLEQGAR